MQIRLKNNLPAGICFDLSMENTFTMEKKYSKGAENKISKVMHEYKTGKLKSSSGDKVKSRKQAVAIGISEARAAGKKVPPKRTSTRKRQKA